MASTGGGGAAPYSLTPRSIQGGVGSEDRRLSVQVIVDGVAPRPFILLEPGKSPVRSRLSGTDEIPDRGNRKQGVRTPTCLRRRTRDSGREADGSGVGLSPTGVLPSPSRTGRRVGPSVRTCPGLQVTYDCLKPSPTRRATGAHHYLPFVCPDGLHPFQPLPGLASKVSDSTYRYDAQRL